MICRFFGLRKRRRERRLADNEEELAFHLAVQTENNLARGLKQADAQTAARRKLGNTTRIREKVHEMNTITWLEQAGKDVRYAFRFLRHNRAFTATAILTLALGIGGNSAIFSLVESVLLKPLPYDAPDRLIYLSIDHPNKNEWDARFSPDRLQHLQGAKTLTAIGAFGGNGESVTLSGRGRPVALKGARVSANFLQVLGVHPVVGRSFLPSEDVDNGPPAIMISYGLWSRRFNANENMVGKLANIDGKGYTVVGVLPPAFNFPFPNLDILFTRPANWSALPSRYWRLALIQGIGRLRPGISLAQASAEVRTLDQNFGVASHAVDPGTVHLTLLQDRLVENIRFVLRMLWGAVAVVLLIACANVANLLLARSATRRREFAVRTSLGASRFQLLRQLLVESIVLALSGGLLGIALAFLILRTLSNVEALNLYRPTALTVPGVSDVHMNAPIVAFTLVLSLVSGLLFGLAPALHLARPNLADALRQSGAAASGSLHSLRRRIHLETRTCLVIGQIAFSVVLLVGAALLMRSVRKLEGANVGFDPDGLLTSKIALSPTKYGTDETKAAFYRNLVDRVGKTPGVRSVAVAMSLPTTVWIRTNITRVEGRPAPSENDPLLAVLQSVTPSYFQTLRVAIRHGRDFERQDNEQNTAPVVIVNEALAAKLWPDYKHGFNPVGLHMSEGYDKALGTLRIIGVVANVHEGGPGSQKTPEFYLSTTLHPPQNAYLVVRTTAGSPLRLTDTIRLQAEAVDHDQSIADVKTMDAILQTSLGQRKTILGLLNCFAGTAFVLTMVGVYGTIAYSVAGRTQELGIRRALGAQSSQILRLILREGLWVSSVGVLIGLAAAATLSTVMKSLLFETSNTDPSVLVTVSIAFLLVALFASYLPAKRGTEIDPMQALRMD